MTKTTYRRRVEFMMMKSAHRRLKEICSIMEQTRSSYVPVRRLLMDVRRNRRDVGQFYRTVKKAHRMAVTEERLVSQFDLVCYCDDGSYTDEHRKLKSDFGSAITDGDYPAAERILNRLIGIVSSDGFRNRDLRILVTRSGQGSEFLLGINNESGAPLIIKSVSISSRSSDVRIAGRCSFPIPVNGQRELRVIAHDPKEIDLCIDYDRCNRPYRYFASVECA